MKTALLAPGQGSQYVGMIKDLYVSFAAAKELIDKADSILGYKLSEICFNGPLDELKKTKYTQPALFLHSVVVFEILKHKLNFDCVAGHSVGEYAALYWAGVIEFEDALKLVSLRGELMFKAGEYVPGTMFAIIGAEDQVVEEICRSLAESGNGATVVPANYNCPGQIVVSGSAEFLRQNVDAFKKAGAKIVKELVVSGAFHSPLMEPAKLELEKAITNTKFKDASIPVYQNFTAKPTTKSDEIKSALINQLTSPVLWTQTIHEMYKDGVRRFIEVGAGNVLQGLVKRTVSDCEILGLDKLEDIQNIIS